jgi:hypothetical protein
MKGLKKSEKILPSFVGRRLFSLASMACFVKASNREIYYEHMKMVAHDSEIDQAFLKYMYDNYMFKKFHIFLPITSMIHNSNNISEKLFSELNGHFSRKPSVYRFMDILEVQDKLTAPCMELELIKIEDQSTPISGFDYNELDLIGHVIRNLHSDDPEVVKKVISTITEINFRAISRARSDLMLKQKTGTIFEMQ